MISASSLGARLGSGSVGRFLLPALFPLLVRLVLGGLYLAYLPWATWGDISFYYTLGHQSDSGFYPYLHYWMEYPPVFPWLAVGLWRGLAWLYSESPTAHQFWEAYALSMFCVDAINVILVQRIAQRVHGPRAARFAAVVYAASPVAVWYSAAWYDPLAVLAFLSALSAMLSGRARTAGVLIALGILTKIYPGVLVLALPLALGWRSTWRAVGAMLGTLALVLVPLAVVRGDLLVGSITVMLTRRAWETVPALLAGSYGWGYVVPISQRFTADTAVALDSTGAARLIALAFQAMLLVAIWATWRLLRSQTASPGRRMEAEPRRLRIEADDNRARHTVLLATLAVAAFLVSNKGYSPQFVIWLLPLLLIVWPNRAGLLYVLAFSLHVLAYYLWVFPMLLEYFGHHTIPLETVTLVAWVSVGLRTLLLGGIVVHLCREVLAASCRAPSQAVQAPLMRGSVLLVRRLVENSATRSRSSGASAESTA